MVRVLPALLATLTAQFILNAAPTTPTAVYRTSGGDVALTEMGSPTVYWAGGANLTEPRAAQAPNGDTFMVVLDQWGSLYARIFSATAHQWLSWFQSGGGLVGSPAIAVDSNGTAWVVARSTYNSLWLAPLTYSGFGSWTSLGGIVTSNPAITISSSGIAHIVARDGSGNTGVVYMVRAQNGVSLGWITVGGVIQGNPALVAGLNGTVHLIARDPWNSAWVGIISGTTCTWGNGNFPVDQDPSGIHVNNVVTMVAARSNQIYSGAVNVTNNNPVWGAWTSMGQAGTSASAASVQTSLAVAARDLTGQLVWRDPVTGWASYGSSFSGGALSTGPTGSSTLIGNYTLTTNVSPSAGGSITPNCPSGCSYPAGSQVQITAASAAGYQFSGFTGADSTSGLNAFVGMNANRAVTANFTVLPPSITSISPASGAPGTAVTLSGTGFGTSGTVSFNGTLAPQIDSWTPTSVIARVPAAATTGLVTLSTGAFQTTFQQQFQVTSSPGPPPQITSLSLPSGPPQVGFEINGSNFGSAGSVTLSTYAGQITSTYWTASKIIIQVPSGTPTGTAQVKVTVGTATSNQVPFQVVAPFGCNF